MANQTQRFALSTLDSPGDTIGQQGFKFSNADRKVIDSLLANGVEDHRHTGQIAISQVAPDPPLLSVLPERGRISASTAVHYKYGIVDSLGQEQIGSKPTSVVTPAPLVTPASPTLTAIAGGTLAAGQYSYAITAFAPTTPYETRASDIIPITRAGTGSIQIQFPVPPTGAGGFNVYRRGPTETEPHFLRAVPVTHITNAPDGAVPYIDDGTVAADSLRPLPTANNSNSVNGIRVSPPHLLATGFSWRIYRTFDLEVWQDSLIAWTDATEAFVDTGMGGGTGGAPLTASAATAGPPQIDLTSETVGILPVGNISAFEAVNLMFPGPVVIATSNFQWVNEFSKATVLGFRAALARDTTASGQAPNVVIEYRTPTGWNTYAQAATIPVGSTTGPYVAIDQTTGASTLAAGGALRARITQGTSGTAKDLLVSIRVVGQV